MADDRWIIVGLGNPGPEYAGTRHNVGQMVLALLAERMGARFKANRTRNDIAEGRLAGQVATLARPHSYMNLSGGPVSALLGFYKLIPERTVVLHDELDVPFGGVRLKLGGGDNGHNGLRSISASLGTRDYYRVRFGIGRPPGRMDAANFVLRDFSAAERKELPFALDRCADAVETLITKGLTEAQNLYHTDPPALPCDPRGARMSDLPPEIDTGKPHPARIYDSLIGGKNNFAADRETVARVLLKSPNARIAPRENRAFLGRAVRFLTAEAGLRQFLDIGTGLPTANNVHEVAQAIEPASRIVYVDNDPLVLVHARALLSSDPRGRTAYIQADVRDPVAILTAPDTLDLLDFSQPVGLLLVGLLHLLADADSPAEIVATLLDALPSGSYLVASHLTTEHDRERTAAGQAVMRDAGMTMQKRDSDVFASIAFTGLELVPPGVVLVSEWRPADDSPRPSPAEVNIYGGVARKPLWFETVFHPR